MRPRLESYSWRVCLELQQKGTPTPEIAVHVRSLSPISGLPPPPAAASPLLAGAVCAIKGVVGERSWIGGASLVADQLRTMRAITARISVLSSITASLPAT